MSFFSKIRNLIYPGAVLEEEAKELEQTVDADQKALSDIPVSAHIKKSTLSPFASRILEQAHKDEPVAPAELFLTKDEAKLRVEDIKKSILEKSKEVTEKFTGAAKAMPETTFNAFAKKSEKDAE